MAVRAHLAFALLTSSALATTAVPRPAAEAQVRQILQLLDYVAVDYGGAVRYGVAVSDRGDQ